MGMFFQADGGCASTMLCQMQQVTQQLGELLQSAHPLLLNAVKHPRKERSVAHRRCASESKLSFMTRRLACLSVCESEVWKREVPAGKVEAGRGTSPLPSISGSGRWSAPLWILLLLWEDATTPHQQLWPPDSYTGTSENCWILF